MEKRVAELEAILKRVQQFTGDYIDHAETWEMCAVAELDADICAALNQNEFSPAELARQNDPREIEKSLR